MVDAVMPEVHWTFGPKNQWRTHIGTSISPEDRTKERSSNTGQGKNSILSAIELVPVEAVNLRASDDITVSPLHTDLACEPASALHRKHKRLNNTHRSPQYSYNYST